MALPFRVLLNQRSLLLGLALAHQSFLCGDAICGDAICGYKKVKKFSCLCGCFSGAGVISSAIG